jgi:hypothetical protein
VWAARAVAVAALAVGVPLFLRMPPWCDLTLYTMAARNLLAGGVHYRDVFDTNLPGFVWALTLIQWVCGESVVAVRAADLLIVAAVVGLLDRLAKWGGASPAGRAWAVAGAAAFYPFTIEMSHAQRDTWMALPGLAAVVLRGTPGVGVCVSPSPLAGEGGGASPPGEGALTSADPRSTPAGVGSPLTRLEDSPPSPARGEGENKLFRPSLLEGLLWGARVGC